MRKKFIPAFAVLAAFAATLTACGRADNGTGTTVTTREAVIDTDLPRETGDIDGDGFIEETVTHAGDIVNDVVTGAETLVNNAVRD